MMGVVESSLGCGDIYYKGVDHSDPRSERHTYPHPHNHHALSSTTLSALTDHA